METIAALQAEVERVAAELARAERELEAAAAEQRRRKELKHTQRIREEKLTKEKEVGSLKFIAVPE
jgi:multidrug resistance efflux pump